MRASNAAPIFAALGDETRLHLVARLGREGPLSIAKLTERTTITRQAVAKHLRVLEGAGVVVGTRDGRESVWKLEAKRLEVAREHLDAISRQWDDTLDRLRAFVEE
jgi:DNA-binding transcriptional ArsR family regulator